MWRETTIRRRTQKWTAESWAFSAKTLPFPPENYPEVWSRLHTGKALPDCLFTSPPGYATWSVSDLLLASVGWVWPAPDTPQMQAVGALNTVFYVKCLLTTPGLHLLLCLWMVAPCQYKSDWQIYSLLDDSGSHNRLPRPSYPLPGRGLCGHETLLEFRQTSRSWRNNKGSHLPSFRPLTATLWTHQEFFSLEQLLF